MLGFPVSERTISRWMQRAPRDPRPAQRVALTIVCEDSQLDWWNGKEYLPHGFSAIDGLLFFHASVHPHWPWWQLSAS